MGRAWFPSGETAWGDGHGKLSSSARGSGQETHVWEVAASRPADGGIRGQVEPLGVGMTADCEQKPALSGTEGSYP